MRRSAAFLAQGGLLIDTSRKITPSIARAIIADARALGFDHWGIWRYFFFGDRPQPGDLDKPELDMLLEAGFWVGGVVHVPEPQPGWVCNGPIGREHALHAMDHAAAAGYVTPTGDRPIAMAIDQEGTGTPAGAGDCVHEGLVVRTAHLYQGVVYCGYDSGLSGAQCDGFVADASCGGDAVEFWCDAASFAQRPKPSKGYAGHQAMQSVLGGIGVDRDAVLRDGVLYGLVEADVYVQTSDPVLAPAT